MLRHAARGGLPPCRPPIATQSSTPMPPADKNVMPGACRPAPFAMPTLTRLLPASLLLAGAAHAGRRDGARHRRSRPAAGRCGGDAGAGRAASCRSSRWRTVDIAQAKRQFDPQLTVVTVGTPVNFPNFDTRAPPRLLVLADQDLRAEALRRRARRKPVVFDKPGAAVLGCNIHDRMAAWVVVVDTPYFARSSATGAGAHRRRGRRQLPPARLARRRAGRQGAGAAWP